MREGKDSGEKPMEPNEVREKTPLVLTLQQLQDGQYCNEYELLDWLEDIGFKVIIKEE